MDIIKTEKLYKTTDIALAATLILKQFQFRGLEPVASFSRKPGRSDLFQFVFVDSDDDTRKAIVMGYAASSDMVTVKPAEFRSTLRYLKEQARNYVHGKGTNDVDNTRD
jgi:hypothetical protein